MKIKKIAILLFFIKINLNLYGTTYYNSDVFFNKYYEIPYKLEKGFYIEYKKIGKINKLILFQNSKPIKIKTEEMIDDNKKITYYDNKNVKKTEEFYNNFNNKIKEITYGKKGKIILQTINYFYKNDELIYQKLKIMNQKPKIISYEKDMNGKLYKINETNLQIWNYGIHNEPKSTYFNINKDTIKAIHYDENMQNLNSAIFIKDTLASKETNIYKSENEVLSTKIEKETKILSKYLNSNLIKEEVFVKNDLKKTSKYLYNSSGLIISEEIISKEGKKEQKTKTEYEYSENKLKKKTIYENDLISLKTNYLDEYEYEQEFYYEGSPVNRIKYKDGNIIEEIKLNNEKAE